MAENWQFVAIVYLLALVQINNIIVLFVLLW